MSADLPARAEALARQLHASQVDKAGHPYVEHLEAVVGILLRRWPDAPEEAVAAAWLHDALEDTEASAEALYWVTKSDDVAWIVEALSRPPGMIYANWIKRMTQDLGLRSVRSQFQIWVPRIKLADLEHNSDPSRAIPGSDLVERRYAPARAVLERALAKTEVVG